MLRRYVFLRYTMIKFSIQVFFFQNALVGCIGVCTDTNDILWINDSCLGLSDVKHQTKIDAAFVFSVGMTFINIGYISLQVVFRKAALFMISGTFQMKSSTFCEKWRFSYEKQLFMQSLILVLSHINLAVSLVERGKVCAHW